MEVIVLFLYFSYEEKLPFDFYIKSWYNIFRGEKMSELSRTTVSDLQDQNKLIFRRGDYNILDCGIRTGKTYWAVNNLKQFTRDGQLNRILFLVDTTALKDSIIQQYDNCADADEFWEHPTSWGETINKIGVMCYQGLGMKAIHNKLDFLENIDVICWDECDSVFDFATQAFVKARKTDFARKTSSNVEVLAIIQSYSTRKEYMSLIILGEWEKLIEEGRIMCIGLSASPERAYAYYKSLVSASYQGKLEVGYRMANDIYFTNIIEHVNELQPELNRGYWCFSPFIEPNQRLVEAAKARGFNAIELHSPNNTDKPMTAEQMRVYNSIVATGLIPPEYDFVIVNKALARGITIIDQRFNHVIIDSINQVDRIQAARQTFQYQRHLKVFAPTIPEEYLNKWITVDECRELAEYMSVPELDKNNKHSTRIMTWNKLKDYLPVIGYTVEGKRKRMNGKPTQCYYISGEWHDVEVVDNDFLQLVNANIKLEE